MEATVNIIVRRIEKRVKMIPNVRGWMERDG